MRKKEKEFPHSEFYIPLLRSYERKEEEAKKQIALRSVYDIKDNDTLVIEKKNPVAQILRVVFQAIFTMLRVTATILLILFATIGLASLLYPNIRHEVFLTAIEILHEIKLYLNIR